MWRTIHQIVSCRKGFSQKKFPWQTNIRKHTTCSLQKGSVHVLCHTVLLWYFPDCEMPENFIILAELTRNSNPLSSFFSGGLPSRMRISISLRLQPILIGPIFNLLSDFWTLASSGPTYISHERSPSGVERKETWHAFVRELGTNGAEGIISSREKLKKTST